MSRALKAVLVTAVMTTAMSMNSFASEWVNNNGKYSFIYDSGEKCIGWLQDGDSTYYLDSTGVMVTGVKQIDGKTYLFNTSGQMQKGWNRIEYDWYYFGSDGAMTKGWIQDADGNWYYTNNDGCMVTGIQSIDAGKYYFSSKHDGTYGKMMSGWVRTEDEDGDDTYYYFEPTTGRAVSGLYTINNKTYKFKSDCKLAKDKDDKYPSINGSYEQEIVYSTVYKSDSADKAKADGSTKKELNKYIKKVPKDILNTFFKSGKITYKINSDYVKKLSVAVQSEDGYSSSFDDDEDDDRDNEDTKETLYMDYISNSNSIELCKEPINVLRGFGRYIDEYAAKNTEKYKGVKATPSSTNEWELIVNEEGDNMIHDSKMDLDTDKATDDMYFDYCYARYIDDREDLQKDCPKAYQFIYDVEHMVVEAMIGKNK